MSDAARRAPSIGSDRPYLQSLHKICINGEIKACPMSNLIVKTLLPQVHLSQTYARLKLLFFCGGGGCLQVTKNFNKGQKNW